jgi:hypothetical protein
MVFSGFFRIVYEQTQGDGTVFSWLYRYLWNNLVPRGEKKSLSYEHEIVRMGALNYFEEFSSKYKHSEML